MQLLGAWMIRTPLARAAAIVRFIAGASSPTRRVAPWHQCWFHMSQMMIAVCAGVPAEDLFVRLQNRCAPEAFAGLPSFPDSGVKGQRLIARRAGCSPA